LLEGILLEVAGGLGQIVGLAGIAPGKSLGVDGLAAS
jgi:hypothetical protein